VLARLGAFFAGWRGLGRFWLLIAASLAVAVVALQLSFSPPAPEPTVATRPAPAVVPPEPIRPRPERAAAAAAPAVQRPGRDTPGPVADPDPALLETAPGTSEAMPRIGADGRMAMQVYAAGFDRSSRRPKVGVVLAGIGLIQAESDEAIRTLPHGITLAVSPYARDPSKLLAAARAAEHEYLLSIPMEPQGFPLNDPGRQALMTNLSSDQNRTRLEWMLSRFAGYVGAIGAEGSLRGERFAGLPEQIDPVLAELAKRGLLYVDPRPGAARLPLVWSADVDILIDEAGTAADIDDKLAQLARLARERGGALGFASAARPVTVQRLAAWANGLAADGLTLAPVSALVQPPPAVP